MTTSPMAFDAIQQRIVWRGDTGYEALRVSMCWNGRVPDRFPQAIVAATSADEVSAVISFARSRDLRVSVRGSGGSWCSTSLRDDGIMLDVSGLNGIRIDTDSKTVFVGPGVTNDVLVAALGEKGLAFPAGHCPGVGIGGYILGGGVGWNAAAQGRACMNIRRIEAVTATGERITIDEEHHADLLWAARGGGAAFPAVVTAYELQAYPLPPVIAESKWLYPLECTEDIVMWSGPASKRVAPTAELLCWLRVAPPSMYADHGGKPMIYLQGVVMADSQEEAERVLSILDECPVRDKGIEVARCAPSDFTQLYAGIGELYPKGKRWAVDQMWLSAGPRPLLKAAMKFLESAPSPQSNLMFYYTPTSDEDLPDMAFSVSDNIFFSPNAIWDDPADDAVNLRWFDEVVEAFQPFATGYFTSETDLFRSPERAAKAFSPPNWNRLQQQVVDAYDPDGVFFNYPLL